MIALIRRSIATAVCLTLLPFGVLAAPAEHVFQPGDEVDVTILTTPDSLSGFSRQYTLTEEGVISLPLIGRVPVAGRTTTEILPELEKQYRKVFAFAFVGLNLGKPKPFAPATPEFVFVTGQVRSPGQVALNDMGRRLSLAEIIGRMGGTADLADLEHVTIYRRQGGVETINFERAMQDGSAFKIELRPGDTVKVPGTWLAAVNGYMPLLQVVTLVAGGVGVLVGWLISTQSRTP
jgi:polysaccharide export outer membrane protein